MGDLFPSGAAAVVRDFIAAHPVLPRDTHQLTVVAGTFVLAVLIHRLILRPRIARGLRAQGAQATFAALWLSLASTVSFPGLWMFLLWLLLGAWRIQGRPFGFIRAVAMVLGAYVLSRMLIAFLDHRRRGILSRAFAFSVVFVIWVVTLLEVVGLLSVAKTALDQVYLSVGSARISLLHFFEGALVLAALLWFGQAVNDAFAAWIDSVPTVTPSFRVLARKIFAAVFYTLTILVALDTTDLDLDSLAWFSGAVGLGLGVGLQKVVSNLASGFAILADKSVKPGDVIQVGDTYGVVHHLASRYVAVLTRDSVEYLIPNEEFIGGKVINWSYSNNLVRLRIPVGIGYGSDVDLAMGLMTEAARAVPRVLRMPEPACILKAFGESSVDFEVRVWVNDPQNGLGQVRSDVLIGIWRSFKAHGIEIPYPQRVVHMEPRGGEAGAAAFPAPESPPG